MSLNGQYYAPQLTEPAPAYQQGSNPHQPYGYPVIQPGPQSSQTIIYVVQPPLQTQYQPQPQPDLEAQIPMEEDTGESKTSQFCCAFLSVRKATEVHTWRLKSSQEDDISGAGAPVVAALIFFVVFQRERTK
ncbi:hypothetical protein B0H16DRAFT_1476352 [Mycena metata]|uniref:Uncharacterized protein n=1 Tax=Mycena metata TaxID=1033252 RepID=A0AAD7HBY3_9AGAR|nr:hypothetical protein B0H16DRAFT_1476352 [Mycena metata]